MTADGVKVGALREDRGQVLAVLLSEMVRMPGEPPGGRAHRRCRDGLGARGGRPKAADIGAQVARAAAVSLLDEFLIELGRVALALGQALAQVRRERVESAWAAYLPLPGHQRLGHGSVRVAAHRVAGQPEFRGDPPEAVALGEQNVDGGVPRANPCGQARRSTVRLLRFPLRDLDRYSCQCRQP